MIRVTDQELSEKKCYLSKDLVIYSFCEEKSEDDLSPFKIIHKRNQIKQIMKLPSFLHVYRQNECKQKDMILINGKTFHDLKNLK